MKRGILKRKGREVNRRKLVYYLQGKPLGPHGRNRWYLKCRNPGPDAYEFKMSFYGILACDEIRPDGGEIQ